MPARLFLALPYPSSAFRRLRKRDESAAEAPDCTSRLPRREMKIVVPDGVRGKWQAVKIAVLDKEQNQEKSYTVDLGQAFTVADPKSAVQVQNFLPAFIMDGTVLTSVSNETRNPAAQIVHPGKRQGAVQGLAVQPLSGNPRLPASPVQFYPGRLHPGKKRVDKCRLN